MSFNRRGPDRRPDRPDRPDRDRTDRPPQRRSGGDYPGRERPPYAPRGGGGDRPSYAPGGGGDRPSYPPRGGGDRPFTQRPRFDRNATDDGGMSIRLDPRRLTVLKQVAAEADVRPGELVRQWVEERIDTLRRGERAIPSPTDSGIVARLDELVARVAALEGQRASAESAGPTPEPAGRERVIADPVAAEPVPVEQPKRRGPPRKAVAAAPQAKRVALHEEIIAVISEQGPMTAADLATAVAERGRYSAPRSGKPLDAAMINGRVSNPTYRPRFTRADGRIGLASEG